MALLSVEDALSRIVDAAEPLEAETVRLVEAGGRVLAADVVARLTQPPFDASAMDGYAVKAAEVAALPVALKLVGESAAGHAFSGAVGPGETVRIFTGAPVPAGADAIVIQENTRAAGDTIHIVDGVPDAAHIRPRGGDFRQGETKLRSGKRLTSRDVLLAAAMGHDMLLVRRQPTVAILATGDELVSPGETPRADQIVSSNPFGLAAMLTASGARPILLGIARDTRDSLAEKIDAAAGADVLITIGGASVGDHDLVVPALEAAGMTLDFWKIAMRPGKPMIFGRRDRQLVLGLPGNPVSSMICTRVFGVPLIQRLLGHSAGDETHARATLAAPIEANGPRAHYMRARRETAADGAVVVRACENQDSSLIVPLAEADCLIVRPTGAPALAAGQNVTILPLDF